MLNQRYAAFFVLLLILTALLVPGRGAEAVPSGLTPTPEPPTLTPTPTPTPPAKDTPTPTVTPTEVWDKSSIQVTGACKEGTPTFTITNGGSGNMTGPSYYWFLSGAGGASTCADSTDGVPPDGSFQLYSGESIDVQYLNHGDPPYYICVAQANGHPGTGFAAAGIEKDDVCVTAEEEVDENTVRSISKLFLPAALK